MTQAKQTTTKYVKALGWLIETAARALAGYLILVNLDGLIATVVAAYMLITAAYFAGMHFVKAYATNK